MQGGYGYVREVEVRIGHTDHSREHPSRSHRQHSSKSAIQKTG